MPPARSASRGFRTAMIALAATAATSAWGQSVSGPVAGTPTLSRGVLATVPADYVVEEYFVSGKAASYVEASPLTADGKWSIRPVAEASYTTRVVVIRPANARRFNGTAVIEWLNVSGGADASASWVYLHRELVRSGYAFVGVSVQRAGIDGGVADAEAMRAYVARQTGGQGQQGSTAMAHGLTAKPLKTADPGRYAPLAHPGDAYAFDIFTQAARAVRGGKMGLKPRMLLATGASQSASYLVTYINAFDPLAKAFDGFLVQARKKTSAPIDGDVFKALRAGTGPFALDHVAIRDDVRVPVLTYITEQDLMAPGLGYIAARQPDGAHIRTWEVAGTSHGDQYGLAVGALDTASASVSDIARAYAAADTLGGQKLARPINAAPQGHYVLEAGLAALRDWVSAGIEPPTAAPLDTVAGPPVTLAVDAQGNATGGVRSPWVDVPMAKYAGLGDPSNVALSMMGSTEGFDAQRLGALYPGGRADYLQRFEAALDATIARRFILPADRAEILALAAAMYPAP